MAKKMKTRQIIGIVLLAAGAALLVIGIWQFVEFRQSAGGKLASGINKVFGSGKLAKGYVTPLVLMGSGLAAGIAGFLTAKR